MKTVFSLLLLALCSAASAQKMPEDYLLEGNAAMEAAGEAAEEGKDGAEKRSIKKAVSAFEYIVRHHPRSDVYPMAFYNLAVGYHALRQNDRAKNIYLAILRSDFNELQPIGGGIMDDPYANYRHRASDALSRIHERQGRLDSALYYFALSDTAYPYQHFCGNEYAAQAVYAAARYADLLTALGRPAEARARLLKEAFLHEGLTGKEPVFSRLRKMLGDDRERHTYRAALDRALAEMRKEEVTRGDYSYTEYRVEFLGVEMRIPERYGYEWGPGSDDEKPAEEAIREAVRKSEFYKLVAALDK